MIVVADTTPLRYLIEIEASHVLHTLFGKVIIPEKVFEELQGERTPQKVKDWVRSAPGWLEVRKADTSLFTPVYQLHAGELEAFALVVELKADALLIDERNGRREAKRIGQFIIPTLALLEIASQKGLVDLPMIVERLSQTTFHISQRLLDELLDRDRKRREGK